MASGPSSTRGEQPHVGCKRSAEGAVKHHSEQAPLRQPGSTIALYDALRVYGREELIMHSAFHRNWNVVVSP